MFDVSLKVVVTNNRGEVLLLKARRDSEFLFGFYDLPGGRINREEMNQKIAVLIKRELVEEVGSKVRYKLNPKPLAVATTKFKANPRLPNRDGKLFLLFSAKYLSGQIVISDEHDAFCWKKLNTTTNKKFLHPIFQQLLTNFYD